jgi:hypothetical protein
MPLQPASQLNLKRNRVVTYVNSAGKSQNALVRAVTGATLTLYLVHEKRQVTTTPKATAHRGPGWHYRTA